jgi:Mg/Co/Ni transporter MgtE
MLERYKKFENGYIKLAELVETSLPAKQKKILEVSLAEDFLYTEKVLSVMLVWDDILALPDLELSEILHKAKPASIAVSILNLGDDIRKRVLVACQHEKMGKVKELFEYPPKTTEAMIVSSRLDLVAKYRECIKENKLPQKTKDPSKVKTLLKL